MNEDIELDLETFTALNKMLRASEEDMELALENIKNLKVNSLYHKFFLKDLWWEKRAKYQSFFNLYFEWEDLTLSSLDMSVKNDKASNKKNIKEIYKSIYNSNPIINSKKNKT